MKMRVTGRDVREYLVITLGLLIYTLGWTLFIIPQGVVGGGASGIGAIVYYVTGFPVGYTFLIFNVVMIGIAMWLVGPGFGVKTIYAVIVASAFLTVEQMIFSATGLFPLPKGLLPDDALLSTVIGGVMSGLGIGIAFSQGGSTGGTDIIAIIINKFYNVTPGRVILYVDMIIITSGLIFLQDIPFVERLEKVVYGYLTMIFTSYMIDTYLAGLRQSHQVMIFTRNYGELSDRIVSDLGRSATVLSGQGWYTKSEVKIVFVVVRKHELNDLYRILHDVDPSAFASVSSVMGVFGRGFEALRY